MFEPTWTFAFFTFVAGGALGFWCCAAMNIAAHADAKDAQAHEHLPDGWK